MYWNGASIREKIFKICDAFDGHRFDLPHHDTVDKQIRRMSQSVVDARNVLVQTRNSMKDQLNHFNNNANNNGGSESNRVSTIFIYQMFLAKEKELYTKMNMMVLNNQTFISYFWAPADEQSKIMQKLEHLRAVRVSVYENHLIARPTYIKTNEFTEIFQVIVDTYGTPTYLEANPAVISIASFPFFFGMMFGDMGHGSILALFALYVIMFAKRLQSPQMKWVLKARYLLFIMGIMSTWAGLIYNEFFAMPTNLFGSCYNYN